MTQKGNYTTPIAKIIQLDENDMLRTSLELTDGISLKYNRNWIDGGFQQGGSDK